MSIVIIAEAGVNHNGELELALKLIDAAVEAGADIIKFQTSNPAVSVTSRAPKADYQLSNTSKRETQLEMLNKLSLSKRDHHKLLSYSKKHGIEFLSTPFYLEGIEFLVYKLKLNRLKIGSGEIVNAPLLMKAAQCNVPIILSTGMCTLDDIERALGVLAFGYMNINSPSEVAFRKAYESTEGKKLLELNVTLLQCTTEYPTPYDDVNLLAMDTLAKSFQLPVGLSDHTIGFEVAVAAAARGAKIIEKHLTLDKNLSGPDHKASLEPKEFHSMVSAIRNVEKSMGKEAKVPSSSELITSKIVRKSLVAGKNIEKGEKFSKENIAVKRPGDGLSPFYYWDLLGKISDRDYKVDDNLVRTFINK